MRLIDAEALMAKTGNVRRVSEYDETGCSMEYSAIPEWAVMLAPAVDAVEVVRCKDCVYRGQHDLCPMCVRVYLLDVAEYLDCTEDDGFCHRGLKLKRGAEG